MRKNSTIMLLLFVILIIGCSCESRVPMYQVTEEKKNNEMMELMEEYGTNITIDHIIEEYYSNEPEAEFDDKYIISDMGYKKLIGNELNNIKNYINQFIAILYTWNYTHSNEETINKSYTFMSPELKSAVQSDGYFIKLLNDVKQYNAVYVIPTGTVIPEGYIKVFEGSEGTVYRAFAEIKICVSADEQFLHIYPNINRGNTRLLLWFYISISENGEMQLIKWIEDYKGQETQKVFAF